MPDEPTRKRRRPTGPVKWTPEAQARFLDEYSKSHCFMLSCKAAGVSHETVRKYRLADPAFAAACQDAENWYVETVRNEVRRRGIEGWVEPRFNANGKMVGGVRKFSDPLLIMLAKKHDHGFREHVEVESTVTGRIEVPLDLRKLSPEAREALRLVAEEQARVAGVSRLNGAAVETAAAEVPDADAQDEPNDEAK